MSELGEVYLLAVAPPDVGYVFVFDSDGKFQRKIRLDIPIRPHQIGVYPSGSLLIAGRRPISDDPDKRNANPGPLIAIFNERGQLSKTVELQKYNAGAQKLTVPFDGATTLQIKGAKSLF